MPCIALVKVESKLLALQMAALSLVNWAVQKFKGPLQPKYYFLSISTSKHIVPNPVDKYTHNHWESHKKCFCLAFLQKSASQDI